MSFPPGPDLPLDQMRRYYKTDPLGLIEKAHEECGDIFTLNLGVHREKDTNANGYWVFLSRPDQFKTLFKAPPDVMHSGAAARVFFGSEVAVGGIARLDEDAHLRRRRFLMPLFSGEKIRDYFPSMYGHAGEEVAEWPVNKPFEMLRAIQKITIDVIIDTVLGIGNAELADALAARLIKVENAEFSRDEVVATEKELSRAIFQHIDECRFQEKAEAGDICSLLLAMEDKEDGTILSKKEIHDELIGLLKAGFASVSNTLCWTFNELLAHPGVMERVRNEVSAAFADGPLTSAKVEKMAYLEATLMEVLRFRPLSLFNGVRLLTRAFEIDGYILPEGTILTICSYLLHRRSEIYDGVDRFMPERFLHKKPPAYGWLPFGGGIRMCIARDFAMQEMKTIAATVLHHLEARQLRLQREKPVTKAIWQGFFLSPEHGLQVRLVPGG
jgi:cytochrome P450